jgi:hypothetical protein
MAFVRGAALLNNAVAGWNGDRYAISGGTGGGMEAPMRMRMPKGRRIMFGLGKGTGSSGGSGSAFDGSEGSGSGTQVRAAPVNRTPPIAG